MLVWQSPEALPFGKHSGVYIYKNLQTHIISQSNSWMFTTERKNNRIHTLTGIPTKEQSVNTTPGSKGKGSMVKQPQTKFISSYVKWQNKSMDFLVYGAVFSLSGEKEKQKGERKGEKSEEEKRPRQTAKQSLV